MYCCGDKFMCWRSWRLSWHHCDAAVFNVSRESGRICWRIYFLSVVSGGTIERGWKRLKRNRYYNLWTRACMCIVYVYAWCVLCCSRLFMHACMHACVRASNQQYDILNISFLKICVKMKWWCSAHIIWILYIIIVMVGWYFLFEVRTQTNGATVQNEWYLTHRHWNTPCCVRITHFVCVIHFVNFIYKLYDLL